MAITNVDLDMATADTPLYDDTIEVVDELTIIPDSVESPAKELDTQLVPFLYLGVLTLVVILIVAGFLAL